MANPKGNPQNLRPIRTLSSEIAKERGSKGGKASVKARKEKKLISQSLAEYFGSKDLTEHFDKMMKRNDSVSVALLKVAADATEGQKMQVDGGITIKIDNDDNAL